jgi:hypothetical protein
VAPDPHYYAARDLDTYPWPLAPLPLEHLAGVRSGEVRLELLIDELGVVREVLSVGRARPDLEDEELRAALTAAQFVPARKDGRAVKARVWMSIRYDANSR